jgi:DNA gyrase/topoisomerase IV subunit A
MEVKEKRYSEVVDMVEGARQNIIRYGKETFRRAFPDYRDGIKPVGRRILISLWDMHISDYTKVASISGKTLLLHPHGDASVNDALVRLSQPWVMNYPLIAGHGNIGNQSGDAAAGARYLEAKLSDFSLSVIFDDLDKVSVNYEDNYNYTLRVPEYFPTKIPLVLINGISGIGEAFMVEIPPHNLNEIADICIKYLENKAISNDELVEGLFPDFPTGGEIINGDDLQSFYKNGGTVSIIVRGKADLVREKNTLILKEFPYGVNTSKVELQVHEARKNGNMILQGIENILDDNGYEDEDDEDKGFDDKRKNKKHDKTYEYICKKDSSMLEILQELYRTTDFQSPITMSFIVNEKGNLKYVKIKNIVEDWYKIRFDSKRRKHTNAIAQLHNRKHVLEGVLFIYPIMDEVIACIKENKSNKDALIKTLHDTFKLTVVQARGIYEMSLGNLSQFGRADLEKTIHDLAEKIAGNERDLNRIDAIIIEELKELKTKFGRPRKTTVIRHVEAHKMAAVTVSKGAMIVSHNAIGLFDANGVKDSKNIITGLRPSKVEGKNIRIICSGQGLANRTPIGFILSYLDGTVNRIPITTFKVINAWYHLNSPEFVSCGTPIYSEDDILVCLTEDKKLKRIEAHGIPGPRKLNTGSVISRMVPYNEQDGEQYEHLLMVGSDGTYHLSDLDDIPLVARQASGVKSSYEGFKGATYLLPMPGECFEYERLFLGAVDTRDNQNYLIGLSLDHLKVSGRVSKPKKLALPEAYAVSAIAVLDVGDKLNQVCMIGRNSTATLSVTHFKKSYEPKRVYLLPQVITLL